MNHKHELAIELILHDLAEEEFMLKDMEKSIIELKEDWEELFARRDAVKIKADQYRETLAALGWEDPDDE